MQYEALVDHPDVQYYEMSSKLRRCTFYMNTSITHINAKTRVEVMLLTTNARQYLHNLKKMSNLENSPD
jgi:hypothetical protein